MTGGAHVYRPDNRDGVRWCGERPTGCMGFVAMQRACVLPLHHGGDVHQSKDGTTFPRKVARRVVPERAVRF